MKINGKKVSVRRDRLGPFDAYYEKGCMLSTVPYGKHVVRAFDYDGSHIGIISKDWQIGQKLLFLMVPVIASAIVFGYLFIVSLTEAHCIIYRPHAPYRIDASTVSIDITNVSSNTLYITVEDKQYELFNGDTLGSVSISSSSFMLKLEYDGHVYTEGVTL